MGNKLADQASRDLTDSICEVLTLLDRSPEAVYPTKFLEKLEEKHALYKGRQGSLHMQQDAGECLMLLMGTLTETLRNEERESANLIKSIFGVDLLTSDEDGEKTKTESVDYLNCLIPDDVNDLLEGVELALREQNSCINRLPRYLTINLERVKWDESMGQSVKHFGKLLYPLEFNAYKLCSDEMKHELDGANRKGSMTNFEDIDKDAAGSSTSKEQLTGIYDLIALIAHEGPTFNSGHYVALVKQEDDQWIQFSDEIKTFLKNEEVLKLSGGENGLMAYICLYKARVG